MRLFTAVFCFSVALSFAAGSAEAGYVAPDWGSNTNNSLTATSSGLFWLNTGSGPSLLTTDINLEIWGGTTEDNTSLAYADLAQTIPAILLVSDHSGFGSYGAVTQWQPEYPGYFSPGEYHCYLIPGTTQQDSNTAWVEVKAWTGDYPRYTDAYAASARGLPVYIADVKFQNPTTSITTVPPAEMTGAPAIVLQRGGLLGDANYDGKVDINDLTIVLANFGQTGTTWSQGDFNADGKVDINDLTIVLANYGHSVGVSGAGIAAVPEPGALALLAAGLVGLLASAWRRWRA